MAHGSPKSMEGEFDINETNADASTAQELRAGQAGKVMKIVDVVISTEVATDIALQDEDDASILGPLYFPANSIFAKHFNPALTCPVGKALEVKAGDAGNVTVTITGYDRE